jgi:hypothetical protein
MTHEVTIGGASLEMTTAYCSCGWSYVSLNASIVDEIVDRHVDEHRAPHNLDRLKEHLSRFHAYPPGHLPKAQLVTAHRRRHPKGARSVSGRRHTHGEGNEVVE